jgi:hypothetical protein
MKTLDTQMIQRLYEFGGLYAYEVRYFDCVTLAVTTELRTFSQSAAEAKARDVALSGFHAWVVDIFIRFDGAFSYAERSKLSEPG